MKEWNAYGNLDPWRVIEESVESTQWSVQHNGRELKTIIECTRCGAKGEVKTVWNFDTRDANFVRRDAGEIIRRDMKKHHSCEVQIKNIYRDTLQGIFGSKPPPPEKPKPTYEELLAERDELLAEVKELRERVEQLEKQQEKEFDGGEGEGEDEDGKNLIELMGQRWLEEITEKRMGMKEYERLEVFEIKNKPSAQERREHKENTRPSNFRDIGRGKWRR